MAALGRMWQNDRPKRRHQDELVQSGLDGTVPWDGSQSRKWPPSPNQAIVTDHDAVRGHEDALAEHNGAVLASAELGRYRLTSQEQASARDRSGAGSAATSVSLSCGDVTSDQGSRRALQPLGHGRIPLGGCAVGHRDCGWAAPGAPHRHSISSSSRCSSRADEVSQL
jgi:hypothetical protein